MLMKKKIGGACMRAAQKANVVTRNGELILAAGNAIIQCMSVHSAAKPGTA
jgi:hypothetical protein